MLRTNISIQIFSTIVSLTIISITSPFVSQPVRLQTPTFEATPIGSEYWIPPLLGYDPHLICPNFGSHQEGASWNNLIVGSSSLSELEQILYSMGVYEKAVRTDQSASISIGYSLQTEGTSLNDELPVDVEVCAEGNIVTVIALLFGNQRNPLYLMDFARQYDVPDVVTWTPSVQSRIAFWFEKGVAAEIFVGTEDQVSFGRIFRVIYFPYQNKRGYEQ